MYERISIVNSYIPRDYGMSLLFKVTFAYARNCTFLTELKVKINFERDSDIFN